MLNFVEVEDDFDSDETDEVVDPEGLDECIEVVSNSHRHKR